MLGLPSAATSKVATVLTGERRSAVFWASLYSARRLLGVTVQRTYPPGLSSKYLTWGFLGSALRYVFVQLELSVEVTEVPMSSVAIVTESFRLNASSGTSGWYLRSATQAAWMSPEITIGLGTLLL